MITMKHYPFLDLKTVNDPYRDAMVEAMTRVVDSGWYVGGPEVEAFESALAAYCDVPYVVGLTNGLDALRLALRGRQIRMWPQCLPLLTTALCRCLSTRTI